MRVHRGFQASIFCEEHTPWPGQNIEPLFSRTSDLPQNFKWPTFPTRHVQKQDFNGFDSIPQAELLRFGSDDVSAWQARFLQLAKDRLALSDRKLALVYPHWLDRRRNHPRGPLLREYDRVMAKMIPITQNLLRNHIDDLEMKLRPGMVTLTWTSMNIDSYKLHVQVFLSFNISDCSWSYCVLIVPTGIVLIVLIIPY